MTNLKKKVCKADTAVFVQIFSLMYLQLFAQNVLHSLVMNLLHDEERQGQRGNGKDGWERCED